MKKEAAVKERNKLRMCEYHAQLSEKKNAMKLYDCVAFWVTNPCRITCKVNQTKMYVCTFEEFILVDIWIHCCAKKEAAVKERNKLRMCENHAQLSEKN